MTHIASASITSSAPAGAFFARWADMATWPEWNADTEWVRLDGPFVQGATGTLKPKGGPKVPFVVSSLTDTEFVDVSTLFGAKLTFDHQIRETPAGTTVEVNVSISGPFGRVWTLILGKGLRSSAQPDLDSLRQVAEASAAA